MIQFLLNQQNPRSGPDRTPESGPKIKSPSSITQDSSAKWNLKQLFCFRVSRQPAAVASAETAAQQRLLLLMAEMSAYRVRAVE